MSEEGEGRSVNSQFAVSVLDQLKLFYEEKLLTDITLLVEDHEFHCHKIILATCSSYFRAMFMSGLSESKQSHVHLRNVDPITLQTIIAYAYTGNLEITHSTVELLYETACGWRSLCLPGLSPALALCGELCAYTKFGRRFWLCRAQAQCPTCGGIKLSTRVSRRGLLAALSHSAVRLLGSDALDVEREETVRQAAALWLEHDSAHRERHLSAVLSLVRVDALAEITQRAWFRGLPQNHKSIVIQGLYKSMPKFFKPRLGMTKEEMLIFVDTDLASEYNNHDLHRPSSEFNNLHLRHSPSNNNDDDLPLHHLASSNDDSQRSITCYSPQAEKVYKLTSPPDDLRRFGILVTPDNDVFVAGGEQPVKNGKWKAVQSFYWLDAQQNSWVAKASMLSARTCPMLVFCHGCVYAIGGDCYDDDVSGSHDNVTMECYDRRRDEWSATSSMPSHSTPSQNNMAAATVNDNIYIIFHDTMFRYTPRNDVWTEITVQRRRSCLSSGSFFSGAATAAVFDDLIFYFSGGGDGAMEIYDTTKDEWRTTAAVPIGDGAAVSDVCLRVVVLLDTLCVFVRECHGGYALIRYDVTRERWLRPQPIPHRALGRLGNRFRLAVAKLYPSCLIELPWKPPACPFPPDDEEAFSTDGETLELPDF
ncbi:Kelch repeat and BTB domain-containing protein 2 [Bagarius yarrelli]|uniref:Kelch repeat and BTB domain-containing protein 2 n=1 Tax=Bagarius yarrelli TaxID=175774 RepID=A0A556VVS5_BAGYA|nr:Kelch repeat and BTB domain-containing protein 2 [Bagarius yarrelli]